MGNHKFGLGLTLSKWFVFSQNFIFFLIGTGLLGFTGYLLAGGHVPHIDIVKTVSIGLLVVGGVVLFVSFFGCCGAIRLNRGLLGIYFFFVLLLVLAVGALGVVSFSNFFKVDTVLEDAWEKFDNQTKTWIYKNFDCCGFVKPDNSTACKNIPHVEGCKEKLEDWVNKNLTVFIIAAVVFAAFLILGLTLTCCLFCAIPSVEEEKRKEEKRLIQLAKEMNQKNYNSTHPDNVYSAHVHPHH